MNGYVQNISLTWTHAMKRSIGPLSKVPLDELYEQYGEKHDLKSGKQFVNWLDTVKLRDKNRWKIVYKDSAQKEKKKEDKPEENKQEVNAKAVEEEGPPKTKFEIENTPVTEVTTKMDVEEVVGLPVRKAREIIPKINDVKLLKYAIQEANPRPGKDTLCQILRKRVIELETFRR